MNCRPSLSLRTITSRASTRRRLRFARRWRRVFPSRSFVRALWWAIPKPAWCRILM